MTLLLSAMTPSTKLQRHRYWRASLRRADREQRLQDGLLDVSDRRIKSGPVIVLPAVAGAVPGVDVDHIWCTDALNLLRALPDRSVHCIVTSPPYWNLRDYGVEGQMGSESTPQAYVEGLVCLFREMRRVLRDDGTIWLNIGDAYANDTKSGGQTSGKHAAGLHGARTIGRNRRNTGLPPKSMTLIPFRLAIALQDDGWIIRSDIIWAKPNCMPESVKDRPTKAHEYIFLITKEPHYYYDAEAIREPQTGNTHPRGTGSQKKPYDARIRNHSNASFNRSMTAYTEVPGGRNSRTVWSVQSKPLPFDHYAAFPLELAERMILAGCPHQVCSVCGAPWIRVLGEQRTLNGSRSQSQRALELAQDKGLTQEHLAAISAVGMADAGKALKTMSGAGKNAVRIKALALESKEALGGYYREFTFGARVTTGWQPTCKCDAPTKPGLVLDPFMGAGTTALAARSLGRSYIGSELNPAYVAIARERLRQPFEQHHIVKETRLDDLPLFQTQQEA